MAAGGEVVGMIDEYEYDMKINIISLQMRLGLVLIRIKLWVKFLQLSIITIF